MTDGHGVGSTLREPMTPISIRVVFFATSMEMALLSANTVNLGTGNRITMNVTSVSRERSDNLSLMERIENLNLMYCPYSQSGIEMDQAGMLC